MSTAVATVLLLCVAGCGTGSDGGGNPPVEEGLTDAKARQQIYDYLRKTLAELPAGLTLSLQSEAGRGPFDPGKTVVCSDSDSATPQDTPVSVQVYYWLVSVPVGSESHYFDKVRRIWEGWGWQERPGSDDRDASYEKPGDPNSYLVDVANAENGPGSLSLAVSSPCFWSKDDATVDPPLREAQPKVIERPTN